MEELSGMTSGLPAVERTVAVVTLEIRTLHRQAQELMLSYAIEIGRRLVEVKEMLPHGAWGTYLQSEVEYSQSTANNFMQIFREYGADRQSLFGGVANSQTLGNLPYTKALALLALPAEGREEFAATHDVEQMSARELAAAVREKKAAQEQAEVAEVARLAAEEQMKMAEYNAEEAEKELERLQAEQDEANKKLKDLQDKVLELENPTVDVAVEVADPAELERAREDGRKEGAQALEAELVAAKEKADKAAERAVAAIGNLEKAKAEADTYKADAQRLQKELAVAGNKDVAAFGVHFKNVQTAWGMMMEHLENIKVAGDVENHGKLMGAARALLEAWSIGTQGS